ncbi:MAG: DUF4412 domain-containing protein [Bacteroidales bacterium]|nr:DUF4412 domain-containing protein [Bacteroidales bacterium]MDD2425091.1 DUF4412 domain-containing protein [Bacteroidales bacterium]MDD3988594.1 DUF4412 domain-containing protein [Bacteroidales bacterium]MDD4639362.1 DUF4412 domain-containing protein [Bacteroidales bacterium]
MKKLIFILSILILLGGCSGNRGNRKGSQVSVKDLAKSEVKKRYPIESGIVRSKSEAAGIESTIVTYFDKWGEWEATETTIPIKIMGQDMTSRRLEIIKGDDHWSIDLKEKTGTHFTRKRAISSMGVDVENVTDEVLGKMNMEKLGEEEHLGYKCQKFRIKSDKGTEMEYLMFGNVMMKMKGEAMGMKTTLEVTSIEETVPPKEVFEIPEDVTITEE